LVNLSYVRNNIVIGFIKTKNIGIFFYFLFRFIKIYVHFTADFAPTESKKRRGMEKGQLFFDKIETGLEKLSSSDERFLPCLVQSMKDGLPTRLLLYNVHCAGLGLQTSLWVNPTYIGLGLAAG
jgi:hypothetical protein